MRLWGRLEHPTYSIPPKKNKGSPAGPEAGDGQEEWALSELFLGQH